MLRHRLQPQQSLLEPLAVIPALARGPSERWKSVTVEVWVSAWPGSLLSLVADVTALSREC